MADVLPFSQPIFEGAFLAPKVQQAWRTLSQRCGELSTSEMLEHVFAHYVLGLTAPFYGERDPRLQLDVCRDLLGIELAPDRVQAVLRQPPPVPEPQAEAVYDVAERQGVRDGEALRQVFRSSGDSEAVPPPLRVVASISNS